MTENLLTSRISPAPMAHQEVTTIEVDNDGSSVSSVSMVNNPPFTMCCPCKCCLNMTRVTCFNCFECIKICCCPCIPRKLPHLPRSFELTTSIFRNAVSIVVGTEPNYRVIRMLAHRDPPGWLPIMASGMRSKKGKHIDDDESLPAYEYIFPKKEGIPDFGNDSSDKRNILLYFHGGGFIFGTTGTHRQLSYFIAKSLGVTIMSIAYRLAPEFPYPIPGQDCLAAYKWLIGKIDSSRIILCGDSAGAALVVETLVKIRELGLSRPKGSILLSPFVDQFDQECESLQSNVCFDLMVPIALPYAGILYNPSKSSIASVLYHDLRNLGPMIIECGDGEILRDSIIKFVNKSKEAGNHVVFNLYPDMPHVFQLFNLLKVEACAKSMENIKQFMLDCDNIQHETAANSPRLPHHADVADLSNNEV